MAPRDHITTPGHDQPGQDSLPGDGSGHAAQTIPVHAHDATVTLPDARFLLTADYARHGSDMVLSDGHGHTVVLKGYFNTDHPPALTEPSGHAVVSAELAAKLAGPLAPGQYAQAGGGNALGDPIGKLASVKGEVKITHADGTKTVAHAGDPVYLNDQIQSAEGASAGLVLADGTNLSVGQDSRVVLDDLVYDPGAKTGHGQVEMMVGTVTFVSGQIPKTTPDAFSIKTPMTSVGIRGTAGGINVDSNGVTSAALLAENGGSGEISIGGVVINTPGQMSIVLEVGGQAAPPVTVSPQQFGQMFGSALQALPNAAQHIAPQVLNQAIQSFQQTIQQQQQQQQEQQQQQQKTTDPGHTQAAPETQTAQNAQAQQAAQQLTQAIKEAITQAVVTIEAQTEQSEAANASLVQQVNRP